MLLTNTINTQVISSTVAGGNSVVRGTEFRGCSACPAHTANRLSAKPATHRISQRMVARGYRVMSAIYSDHTAWQLAWHDSKAISKAMSPASATGKLSESLSGLSLS